MLTIKPFYLPVKEKQTISVPFGIEFLSLTWCRDKCSYPPKIQIVLFCLIDTDEEKKGAGIELQVKILGGLGEYRKKFLEGYTYLGRVEMPNPDIQWRIGEYAQAEKDRHFYPLESTMMITTLYWFVFFKIKSIDGKKHKEGK